MKRQTLVQISAAAFLVQGTAMVLLAMESNRIVRQAKYLASIVEKNVENLDEFDIIALRELGIIR